MVDGRIARMLGAQSEFGAELDSLADIVAFGVAPAVLAYVWAPQLGPELPGGLDIGILVAFSYTACAALRLARFNVAAASDSQTFQGIPTPVAALLVATTIMMWHEIDAPFVRATGVLHAVLGGAALLMVAPFPFPSFKHFKYRWTMALYFGSMLGGLTMLFLGLPGGTVLLALLGVYLLRGVLRL